MNHSAQRNAEAASRPAGGAKPDGAAPQRHARDDAACRARDDALQRSDDSPLQRSDESPRRAGAAALARALEASRRDTLATFAVCAEALAAAGLAVPYRMTLNPPLWELGHVGWFQEYWLARNPERERGAAADPAAGRAPAVRRDADALYDSTRVAHAARWTLPLPDAATTRRELQRQLEGTLALLARCGDDAGDDALYFFRLALLHEDMHHEAALYMLCDLGIEHPDARWRPRPGAATAPGTLTFDASRFVLGSGGPGFAFDNELRAHEVEVGACTIDRRAVRWRDFLPFVEDGGYADVRWWSDAGRAWLAAARPAAPRYLRRDGAAWLRRVGADWRPLDLDLAASHLSFHEAAAWCRWAGRRLPSEAEWERAAVERAADFAWGEVWEWTASAFAPYPGFVAHPYRDYSQPWFDGRPVLRGASHCTQPRLRDARYRNFFAAARNDIVAGFRSCAAA